MDQIFYSGFRCRNLLLVRRRGRINHGGIEHFSSRIDNGQLASRTKRRVPSKDNLACNRRLHQKLLKVLSKDLDRTILCLFGELISDLTLDGRSDQTVVGILDGRLQNRLCLRILFGDDFFLEITQDFFRRRLNFDVQEFFFLTAVQCQHTVSGNFRYRLGKLIVILVNGLCFLILCCRDDQALRLGSAADLHTVIGLIGNALGDDVAGTSNGVFCRFDFLFF